jgi:hypothetical protein
MSDQWSYALRELLGPEATVVGSAREFLDARRDPQTVSFVDSSTIAELDEATPPGSVIAVCDGQLHTAVDWLTTRPWLSHAMSTSMLQHPLAAEHLGNVMATLTQGSQPRLLDWLGPTVSGRRVRLTQASKRAERLERMSEFFDAKGVGSRTIALLRDAAEELLTNAFYDAPVAAGAVSAPISRTMDVSLPDDGACDMVYGCREDLAVVRVRDPFGSLTRARLMAVLARCSRTDMQVEVDETMGGAGLGLWRIFTAVTFVAISVVAGHHTEFLVGIGKRSSGPRPFSFHLFFGETAKRRFWKLKEHQTSPVDFENSVSIVAK